MFKFQHRRANYKCDHWLRISLVFNCINTKQDAAASPLIFTLVINNIKFSCVSLHVQPSWIAVDFDNWRDWEHEEDDGKEEFDRYADVSEVTVLNNTIDKL